jgi:hypothetical protein
MVVENNSSVDFFTTAALEGPFGLNIFLRENRGLNCPKILNLPPIRGANRRGERYCGRMILVTDLRGEIVARRKVSNPWMLEKLDFLRMFPVGRHFSTEGKRTYPPRAKVITHYWDAV